MKFFRKTNKELRYAGLLDKVQQSIGRRVQRWAAKRQRQMDRLTLRQQFMLFLLFCLAVSSVCVYFICNAFK